MKLRIKSIETPKGDEPKNKTSIMRVDIKTKGKITDKEIRAVYILNEGLKQSSDRMRIANLNFVLGKYGLIVAKK